MKNKKKLQHFWIHIFWLILVFLIKLFIKIKNCCRRAVLPFVETRLLAENKLISSWFLYLHDCLTSVCCRLNASFSAHPEKEELILFGGEFFNGKKVSRKINTLWFIFPFLVLIFIFKYQYILFNWLHFMIVILRNKPQFSVVGWLKLFITIYNFVDFNKYS